MLYVVGNNLVAMIGSFKMHNQIIFDFVMSFKRRLNKYLLIKVSSRFEFQAWHPYCDQSYIQQVL